MHHTTYIHGAIPLTVLLLIQYLWIAYFPQLSVINIAGDTAHITSKQFSQLIGAHTLQLLGGLKITAANTAELGYEQRP